MVAPTAVTVTTPLGPGLTEIWSAPLPTPEGGLTVILDWLEVAVQATAAAGLMFTVTVCGLVMRVPFQPYCRLG